MTDKFTGGGLDSLTKAAWEEGYKTGAADERKACKKTCKLLETCRRSRSAPSARGGAEMNRDDIIRMAQEAGFVDSSFCRWSAYSDDLERFFHKAYAAGAAAEREECAKVCEQSDQYGEGPDCWDWHAKDYAACIRARGEQK